MPYYDPSFEAKLNRKYDILAEEAAARTKSASADYMRAETDAKSLPQYRADLGYHARGAGQLNLEQAATLAAKRYMDPDLLGQLFDSGRLPGLGGANAGTPGTGAPGATAGPPPIVFQTMPGSAAAAQPVVSPTAAAASAADTAQPASVLSPESLENMSPEELATWSKTAATPQGVQGPSAPAGSEAQRRLAAAQARQPSLLRPTSVTTTKAPAASPLYSTGFRRGIPDVKPQGYAEGDADVLLRRPLFGAAPARGGVGGAGAPGGALPPGGPVPMPVPMPAPAPAPAPAPMPGPMAGPPPELAGPGVGTPYNPNAGYGIENLGGIVDATLRMVNPEKFNEALKSFRPSENIEDRRGETYNPNSVSSIASNIGNQITGGGQALASDIWRTVAGDRAAPGSLADQAGLNQIPGTSGGIVGSISDMISNLMGGASAAPAQAAPAAPAAPSFSGGGLGAAEPPEELRKGTANVKGKGGKAGGPPKGLEAILPLLAAMQGGGAGGPPAGPPAGPPLTPGMRKGSANVKGAKGAKGLKKGSANVKGKGSKGSKSDDQPPEGLEAILPALMMAAKGGGAVGPQAGPGLPPAMAPGAAAPPGFARGMSNVRGYAAGGTVPPMPDTTPNTGPGSLPAAPAVPLPYGPQQGAAMWNDAGASRIMPGNPAAAQPLGTSPYDQERASPPALATQELARGSPSVQQMPNYPFGAGYMFGANEVPGQGTGKTDTVPAMLAPHEAVLNKAAADILGRGLIAALNAQGVKQMGMGRGATS